ncbi:MAG: DUF262 domain-containing protein [Microbacterium sp.]|uniref:DUF262 domain-containing protein n=1 Tax=Microbacterium sp. TaxID=51671 RepID=UPI003A84224F
MGTATNIDATAVSTIGWLSAPQTNIVVPVYQRQYRWDIGGCEQLLADVRAVADADDRHMHFIGSVLSSQGDDGELVLIDGQQRITTIMLLVAALHHTLSTSDPALAADLERVLVRTADPARTKLRPHRAWAQVFEDVVLDRTDGMPRNSRFDDNYAFFRSQVSPDEAPAIWAGLQKLEHVSITLGPGAHAQQIFESLNSTGEPLRDHELIHNYVLMGLGHAEQTRIEDEYWAVIEHNTGDAIGSFWRHYLVMSTGREVSAADEHEVYGAFRQRFPRVDAASLAVHAAQWREYSTVYRTLRLPSEAPDAEIGRQLAYLNTFGRAMYPLVMRAYHDHIHGELDRAELLTTIEYVQALLLRRAVVGIPSDRLVARLCRAWQQSPDAFVQAISRITPSDERIRVALRFTDLPHAAYVLGRLAEVDSLAGLEVEHIVPLAPSDTWSGDGLRPWADYSEDEQNSHRALAQSLGNLTLLEQPLSERVFGESFPVKRTDAYARSAIALNDALAAEPAWGTAAISARTTRLTERFLQVWRRPLTTLIDDDGLTPILDAKRRRGWPRGWEREFDYVEFRGEHWEVHDVKHLFHRVFTRLWADHGAEALAFSARRGGPIFPARSWNGHWDALDEESFLFMGWDSTYMLTAVQGVLDETGLASEVFVKYSYIGAAM